MNMPGSTVRALPTCGALRTALLCLLLPAILTLSCSNPFLNYNDADDSASSASSGATTGMLSIQFGGSMLEAQTVTPNPVDPATLTYNILLTRDGFADISVSDIAETTAAVEGIPLGIWNIEVSGLSGVTPVLRTNPGLSVDIAEGANFLTAQLHPLTEGDGGVEITVNWPAGLVSGYDAAQSSFSDTVGGPPQPIDAYTEVVGTQLTFAIPTIASGYYRLTVYLRNNVDAHVATVTEIIHVYDTLVSTASITLGAGDIAQPPSAPTGLVVGYERDASQVLTGITLNWTDTANTEVGFRVFRVLNAGEPTLVSGDLNANTQTYTDTDTGVIEAGDTVSYVVRAFNSFGESADLGAAAGTARALSYDGNGSTAGTVPATGLVYFEGEEVTVLENTGGLANDGYTFGGWNTLADGTGTDHPPNTTFDMPAANLTLHAIWNIESFTLSFDGNGAVAGDVPAPGTYEFGQMVTVPGNTGDLRGPYVENPVITQRFTTWNTAADGTGTDHPAGTTFEMGATNLTLYAQWTTDAGVLGKIGPAGGYVFYDQGGVANGWRWLEAAPEDQSAGMNWSNVGDATIGQINTGLAWGNDNSVRIVNQQAHTGSAAQLSLDYELNGYNDWFLPTIEALIEMNNTLHNNTIGGPWGANYWGTDETGATTALARNMPNNLNQSLIKDGNNLRVRAVRAFSTIEPSYSRVFLENGADSGTALQELRFYEPGINTGTAAERGDLVRAGFGFTGWNTAADGSGASYIVNEALPIMGTDNLVLHARWYNAYAPGDIGPAGGRIFYDKGVVTDGWRFMEAASADTELINRSWGTTANLIGTLAAIGDGLSNTTAIVTNLGDYNTGDYAARLAVDLVFDGYADWFLPSQSELIEMYQRLRVEQDVAGFVNAHYWSSTEDTADNAWTKSFNTGADDSYIKTNALIRVRAARRF